MNTFNQMHADCNLAGHPCSYWGERGEWWVAYGRSRDASTLEESNFLSLLAKLGGESDTVAVERENHWAVGWVEHILIDPADTARVAVAGAILAKLEEYPVVDDEHFSNLEYERFWNYAHSELQQFDGDWESAVSDALQRHNSGPGDETAEREIIEAARERLEQVQPFYDEHASSPIDPRQIPLFA